MINFEKTSFLFSIRNAGKGIISTIPFTKTVSLGILIKCGSVNESTSEYGYSHFLEHMIFKGTENRTYVNINNDFEKLGAYVNAFTDKYFTLFYVNILPEFALRGLELLLEIVFHSILPAGEIEKERNVILEEIDSYNDSPEDVVIESFYQHTFKDSFLAHPILGTKESLAGVTQEKLLSYYKSHYSIDNAIISVAGNMNASEVQKFLENYSYPTSSPFIKNAPFLSKPVFHPSIFSQNKVIEQSYITLGFKAYDIYDTRRYALKIWNMILGELTSSRLYLDIREKKALCYGVESSLYQDAYMGMIVIIGATHPKNINSFLESTIEELQNIHQKLPFTEEELEIAKNQVKSKIAFRQEGSSNIMMKKAIDLFFYDKILDEETIWNDFTKVTVEDLNEITHDLINKDNAFSLITLIPEKHKQPVKLPPLKL